MFQCNRIVNYLKECYLEKVMKTEYWLVIGIISLFIGGVCIGVISYNSQKEIDCDSLSPIYLKANELSLASQIADDLSVVVVIPELNQIIARTEILECSSFDYNRYIK